MSQTEEGRRALAEEAMRADVACDSTHVVATMDRRYANSTSLRYAIEGCGKRALYVEDCTNMAACRYLLVGIVPLAASTPPPP